MRPSLKTSFRAAALAVPSASLLIGVVVCVGLSIQESEFGTLQDVPQISLVIALVGGLLTIVPALLYGAPLYAVLQEINRASYTAAFFIGAAPAAALLWVDPRLAGWVLAFGSLTALFTHRFAKQGSQDDA